MSMFRNAVSANAFITFRKQISRVDFAAGTAHAAHARDENSFSIDCFAANERSKWNQNAGWITARTGNEPRAANLITINFRQSVNRLPQKIGRGMFMIVKFAVNVGIFDSKVGAEIENARAGGQERFCKFGRESMRQS